MYIFVLFEKKDKLFFFSRLLFWWPYSLYVLHILRAFRAYSTFLIHLTTFLFFLAHLEINNLLAQVHLRPLNNLLAQVHLLPQQQKQLKQDELHVLEN